MDSSGKGGIGGSSSAKSVFDTVFINGIDGSIVGGLSIGCRAKVRGVVAKLLLGEALVNFESGKAFAGEWWTDWTVFRDEVLELTVRLPVDMGGLSALVLAAGCTASVDLNVIFLRYSSMPFYG